ncbi:tetratricopeptide repeat protein [Paraburkholderia sp. BCC1886]|uniref:tetratricopeptide repeat-containing glycosyltransferase family protein n=1 Tax=Paraburkholderia sp. BCC1886 TaxID=2562670 RepID=UPI001182B140|nr:tetratricopeptide repeat-containing glycosyltransferase family protein [Paraburkholderia sp. BCC1886]
MIFNSHTPSADAAFSAARLADAHTHLNLALQSAPDRADLWEHAGLVAAMRGDYIRAEAFYHRALQLSGNTATLHRNLADCLKLAGRLVEAKSHYEQALFLAPGLHHAIRNLARINAELGETREAADYWLQAWSLDPSSPQDGFDLIDALAKVDDITALHKTALQIQASHSNDIGTLELLCLTLYHHDRFAEMLTVAINGLATHPTNAKLHHYAAHALSVRGKVAEALVHSNEAVRLAPHDPTLQIQLAWLELNESEYREGWARSNLLYTLPAARHTRVFPDFRVWNGEAVKGCEFLLVGEQGRGDEIQFIRFAHWLQGNGAVVDVMVSEPIARIAASMTCIRTVFTTLPSGPYDYWSHMQRMPEHMKLNIAMLPIAMPYISVPPHLTDTWQSRIENISPSRRPDDGRRIGIVWSGGPNSLLDRFRSIHLDAFKPLFEVPGTSWFSLQKGETECESEALSGTVDLHTLGPDIGDFSDTLAILNTLDLLITVDTSVAHLAGAAGLPVWVLIPAYAQWRWLQHRTDSPWYPSMRLFRQHDLGQWEHVIDEVRDALIEWCSRSKNHCAI